MLGGEVMGCMSLAVVYSRKEARDRVRAALSTARFEFPAGRVTVNLAPADLPKESGRFDLPIAIGILAATGQVPAKQLASLEFAGELALSGELRPIRGALAMTYRAYRDGRAFVLPESVAAEAALARGATVLPARTLLDVCGHLMGQPALQPHVRDTPVRSPNYLDLADVRGQAQARRALEIAATGAHSLVSLCPSELQVRFFLFVSCRLLSGERYSIPAFRMSPTNRSRGSGSMKGSIHFASGPKGSPWIRRLNCPPSSAASAVRPNPE